MSVCTVLLCLLSGALEAQAEESVTSRRGAIRDWLILGPFPYKRGRLPGRPNISPFDAGGRAIDYELIGSLGLTDSVEHAYVRDESLLVPAPGNGWEEFRSPSYVINLGEYFAARDRAHVDFVVAYAACYLKMAEEMRDVTMHVGCDDLIRVWINGKVVHTFKERKRSFMSPPDRIEGLVLRKGWNRILVKVVDIVGGFGFVMYFKDSRGNYIADAPVSLLPPDSASPASRKAAAGAREAEQAHPRRAGQTVPTPRVPGVLAPKIDSSAADLGGHLIGKAGVRRGIGSMLGCGDGMLALAIARASELLVHGIDPREPTVAAARNRVDIGGLLGRRIVIERCSFRRLPYADNMIDLIVATGLADQTLDELSLREIERVLRPGGRVILGRSRRSGNLDALTPTALGGRLGKGTRAKYVISGDRFGLWAEWVKPDVPGTDSWSHWYHGPDNNPVSEDTRITAPYMTQWIDGPFYVPVPTVTTAAGGRVFVAMGHMAHHPREEPRLNTLLARNGYNGVKLWRRKLPEGSLAHRSAFIATDDVFYMIDGDRALMLHPETGREAGEIRIPGVAGEWKWMALQDDILFVLSGEESDEVWTTLVGRQQPQWNRASLSPGYYRKRVPWGFGRVVAAYDMERGKTLWIHRERTDIDSRCMAVADNKVYFYAPDRRIGCLRADRGRLLWANNDPAALKLIEEDGRGPFGIRSSCGSLCTPDALILALPTRRNVVALSTRDGTLLWHHGQRAEGLNVVYADGRLVLGIGPRRSTAAVNPLDGAVTLDLGFAKRACARMTGSPDSLFARGEGLLRYDPAARKGWYNAAFRPGCTDGVVPANGFLYVGPWLCDCNLQLMGTVALCSAKDFRFDIEAEEEDRLEIGERDILQVAPLKVTPGDWPTYRADNSRTGGSQVKVADRPVKRWVFQPRAPVTPTVPTAAGDLVFVGGEDGKVRAIDAKTGDLRWSFSTAGPVKMPPTIWDGRTYIGSGDGHVYALEAVTGRMLWRFRAAPAERRIMVYGSLCSTWPVNSGVLVEDGIAYAAAGIIDCDGTYVYALDGATGGLKWQNNMSGHLNVKTRKGASVQGCLARGNGVLWMAGGNMVSPACYDLKTGRCLNGIPPNSAGISNRGSEVCIFDGRYVLFGGRPFFSPVENVVGSASFAVSRIGARPGHPGSSFVRGRVPPAWDSDIFVCVTGRRTVPVGFEPAAMKSFLEGLTSRPRGRAFPRLPKEAWKADVPKWSDIVSLAVVEGAVLAVVDIREYGGRTSRWDVIAFDYEEGGFSLRHELPSQPLPGGLLVDRQGQIIVVLANGSVLCFGPAEKSSS